MLAVFVATTVCAATWFLTGPDHHRPLGAFFGLIGSFLWLSAGLFAGTYAVSIVAAFCALCFARPFLRARVYRRLRRQHAQ
jgi:hypothetical protein